MQRTFPRKTIARLFVVALTVLVSACASAPAPIDTSGWRGKTLALALESRESLPIYGHDEFIIAIEDPVVHVADALFAAAAEHYGVVAAPEVALPRLANVSDLVRVGQGSDLLLEVMGGHMVEERGVFNLRYWVRTGMWARLIDVQARKALREHDCQVELSDDPDVLSYDELMSDHARRLQLILAREADICLKHFEAEVLGIDAPQVTLRAE
jgi:hypothetical protein